MQNVGRQTFFETFRDTNTKENLEKYLNENFNSGQLTKELNNPETSFFLALINNMVVGYLKINTGDAQTEFKIHDELEIERIYVIKSYWGKSVGQSMLDFALHFARQKNKKTVWLGVWEKNIRAIRFYEKNRFAIFGKHAFKVGEDIQTDLLMRLSLG
ncbi:MAG: GNAT family N-acetyltransferase [Bacteroidales bacterium]|nr:GNAT family N-acetyltransferase [Bacteroidales bacterium]